MTSADLVQLKEALALVKETGIVKPGDRVGIHSPWAEQVGAMKDAFGDGVIKITRDEWDIKVTDLKRSFDLLVFCNVFMYIDEPAVAFENVLNSCRYLLIQDIIKRDRGPEIFGSDGDCMRYEYHEFKSNYTKAFDIGKAGRVIRFVPYADDGINVHFVAVMGK
jgi:hypothetical protein